MKLLQFTNIFFIVVFAGCASQNNNDSYYNRYERYAEEGNEELVARSPVTPGTVQPDASKVSQDWLYGQGIGNTIFNAGGVIAFPPYALYLLGNGLLTFGGYENLYVTDALPDEARGEWKKTFNTVASTPGRVTASISGQEYRAADNQDHFSEDLQ